MTTDAAAGLAPDRFDGMPFRIATWAFADRDWLVQTGLSAGPDGRRSTAFVDLRAWPPRVTVLPWEAYAIARTAGGRWGVIEIVRPARGAAGPPQFRFRHGATIEELAQAEPQPTEPAADTIGCLGECFVLFPQRYATGVPLTILPMRETAQGSAEFAPLSEGLSPIRQTTHGDVPVQGCGTVRLPGDQNVLFWGGNGYEWSAEGGIGEQRFPINRRGDSFSQWYPSFGGPVGESASSLLFTSDGRRLWRARAGEDAPERVFPQAKQERIAAICPSPPGLVLLSGYLQEGSDFAMIWDPAESALTGLPESWLGGSVLPPDPAILYAAPIDSLVFGTFAEPALLRLPMSAVRALPRTQP